MAQFVGDQNTISFRYESGAYGTALAVDQWIGLVQDHKIDENENVIQIRNAGASSRNVQQFVGGARDYTGTLTYYPQDWKMIANALGSCVDSGSPSPYIHTIVESDSNDVDAHTDGNFRSFTVFDGKDVFGSGLNFNRLINGCVTDSLTLTESEGEPLSMEIAYVGQKLTFSSGAGPNPTAVTTSPFLWSDSCWHLPSGTTIPKVKSWSVSVNNNLDIPHYSCGSRTIGQPIPNNREYEISITVNMDSSNAKAFYDQYFQGGSTFNALLAITDVSAGAGSRDMTWTFSGCRMLDMDTPSTTEGTQEQTLTIAPQTSSVIVNDTTEKYNAW